MEVIIPVNGVRLEGELNIPEKADSIVIFAHGSGSSRHSARNKMVAARLQHEGFGTLLFDLLTREEDRERKYRFDIKLISDRLVQATKWLKQQPGIGNMPIGYFGASTGAAAALIAAAALKEDIQAVVSRGGRPDFAKEVLADIQSPILLIVGSLDDVVIDLNERSFASITAEKKMIIIEGASHLFEEPGKLETVAVMAVQWFNQHLKGISVKGG